MSCNTEFNHAQSPTQSQALVPKCIQKIKMHSDFKSDFFINMDLKQNSVTHWSVCQNVLRLLQGGLLSLCPLKHWVGERAGAHIRFYSSYLRFTKNI